jgi:hypothetical protein
MFKVSPASLQTFIDTPNCVLEGRVQYSTVRIPNVFCDGHLQIIMPLEFLIDSLAGRTVALGLTQPLTEMCTGNISWGVKAAVA